MSSLQMDVAPEVWSDLGASTPWNSKRTRIGIALVVAAAVVGISVSFLYYNFWRWWNRKRVLIVGSPGAGKTALFYRLRGREFFWNAYTPTLSPVKEKWERDRVPVQLVDLPGDPRLEECMREALGRADIVIFMIDSTRFLEDSKDTAAKLWDVLGDPFVNKKRTVPTLITLNKCEEGQKMFPDRFITHRLETEIEKVRKRVMQDLQEAPFRFADVKSEVALASISVKNGHMTPVHTFLHKHLDSTPQVY